MSMFVFRRQCPGVYRVHMRDTNDRIGTLLVREGRRWEACWTRGEGKLIRCGVAETRERAAALILMRHMEQTGQTALDAIRVMVRDWHTYQPYMQTVLLDELQQLRDAASDLAAKIEEHIS